MISSSSASRAKRMGGWFLSGLVIGFLGWRGVVAISAGQAGAAHDRSRQTAAEEPTNARVRSRLSRKEATETVALSLDQLATFGKDGRWFMRLSYATSLGHPYRKTTADMFPPIGEFLGLNQAETSILARDFEDGLQRLIALEKASVPFGETAPGVWTADFDSLASERKPIIDAMREKIRRDLGGRTLRDLDVFSGFDHFDADSGQSQNCVFTCVQMEDGWDVLISAPGYNGRLDHKPVPPAAASPVAALRAAISSHLESGRYSHVGSQLLAALPSEP